MNLIKIFAFLIFFAVSASCSGQPNERDDNQRSKSELTSFEEKQREFLSTSPSQNQEVMREESNISAGLNFTAAARKVTPAVVHISSTMGAQGGERQQNPYRNLPPQLREFFNLPDSPRPRQGSGSGVIISEDGYIVTNNHVIDRANDITITLSDNRTFSAEVIGTDPTTDLALVKIDESDLPFVEFGNMNEVQVGEWVLAVGNPFNLSSTVTAGIVSATGRNINILQDQAAVESFIQTDAAINPGNSGGALVNANGKLIGINTAIASPTGAYSGYGFAVPIDITTKVVNDLLNYGVVQRGYLGVFIRNITSDLAEEENLSLTRGVYVDSLVQNGAAETSGIRAGDVIIGIDGKVVNTSPELQSIIAQHRPGDEIDIRVVRNGSERVISATLRNEFGGTEVVERQEEEDNSATRPAYSPE